MSVAETPTTEPAAPNVQQQFAIGSAIGAALLLAGLAFVFGALPMLWSDGWDALFAASEDLKKNVFLSDALLILVELLVIGGLAYGAYVGLQTYTQPGLRAGIVFMALAAFLTFALAAWLGGTIEQQFEDPTVGFGILFVIIAVLLGAVGYVYLKVPGCLQLFEAIEHQGWFHAFAYKGNQGVRVRRGTIVGILAVGACGIYTMITHGYFGSARADVSNDWYWSVPYYPTKYIALMFKVHLIAPILLGVLLFWFAWRVVNIPGFADFLIATEAEMNKVSWTNRKRLVQDTIVVLVTVFLFTTFLFVVDVIWIKVLSAPGIQVLIVDLKQEQEKQQQKAQW
jgi:preprotein translocase SecE subunit